MDPLFALLVLVAGAARAQGFTHAQAEAGKQAYAENCASCHGDALEGVRYGPPLKGGAFAEQWSGKPILDLYEYTSTKMPEENPGALAPDVYAATLAYILQQNGVLAGQQPLTATATWVVPTLRP